MPKIFSEAEKAKIKDAMFESGFELLKEEGMTHMSIDKITASCGIGKSTFYNFFPSKEEYVIQLIDFKRLSALNSVKDRLKGRDLMTVKEGRQLLKSILCSSNSIYQYLKLEDLLKLQGKPNYLSNPDIEEENDLMKELFCRMEGVKEEPDYSLIANLLKIITLVSEEKKLLHEEAYDRTLDVLYQTLFGYVFKEEAL